MGFISRFKIRHFYTPFALTNMILADDVKDVRSMINYLKKHDPDTLQRVLTTFERNFQPLWRALAWPINTKAYAMGIILLEAGAKPHADKSVLSGRILLHSAIEKRNLEVVRLLLWYDPENYLTIVDPETSLTVEELLIEWNRESEPFFAALSERQPGNIVEIVRQTTCLSQQRFHHLRQAELAITHKDYTTAIQHYFALNQICQLNAEIEKTAPYRRSKPEKKSYLIQFYQNYGKDYLQQAYRLCKEDWLRQYKELSALSPEQCIQYQSALHYALALSQALDKPKAIKRYQRLLQCFGTFHQPPSMIERDFVTAHVRIPSPIRISRHSPHFFSTGPCILPTSSFPTVEENDPGSLIASP